MRRMMMTFIVIGLTFGCATTYRSGRETNYEPSYVVSVTFAKEDVPSDSADHSFILEAKVVDGGTIYTQCDRGNSDSEFVVCVFYTGYPEMSFNIRQVWQNVVIRNSDDQMHVGKNVPSNNEYLCATNVKVAISANELRLHNDGTLDAEYEFFLPSDNHEPACQFHITNRTMMDAMAVKADK